MTGAGEWSAPEPVNVPVRHWVSVGCDVGGEVWHAVSEPEPLGGVAELPVTAGRRRQVLACIGLGVRGAACRIGLRSLWARIIVVLGAAVMAAGGVVGC